MSNNDGKIEKSTALCKYIEDKSTTTDREMFNVSNKSISTLGMGIISTTSTPTTQIARAMSGLRARLQIFVDGTRVAGATAIS
jgi:hypothetical protein